MAQGLIRRGLLGLIDRYPIVGVVFGLAVAVACAALSAYLFVQYQDRPDAPLALSFNELHSRNSNGREWVYLSGGTWDCSNLTIDSTLHRTYVVKQDITGSTAVLVTLDKEMNCHELPGGTLEGELFRVDRRKQLDSYPSTTTRYELCSYCGPGNDLIGIIVTAMLALCGFGILAYSALKL